MDYEDIELQVKLLVFGAIEILSGAIILVLGVFLGSMQGIFNFFSDFSFFTFYTGYPIWGPLSFIVTGSSSIAAGRIPRTSLIFVRIGRYLISAVITVVGVVLLSVNLFLTNEWLKNCPLSGSPELCRYMGTSNNGLLSLMLIFTLLEFWVTTSTAITWLTAVVRQRLFLYYRARRFGADFRRVII